MAMSDKEIFECVDKKNQIVIETVSKLFDSHTTSIATLITTENQGLKDHIKRLEDQVIKQNGSVRDLREWRSRVDGATEAKSEVQRKKLSTWQMVGIVFAVAVGLTTATLSVVNTVANKRKAAKVERIENWMDLWDFSPITRGGKPVLDTAKFDIKQ